MSRSSRLLALIQLLRNHHYPVSGSHLAQALDISLRTLYRDIATLQQQGAMIEGEAGLGYILKPGFMLPPLMFSAEELEALVLGSRWVAARADPMLRDAAQQALTKIAAVIPTELKRSLDTNTLLIGPATQNAIDTDDLARIRQAIRSEHKLTMHYRDLQDKPSARIIWPFALGYFDHVRVLVGWCELRQAFRHFRADRILAVELISQRYPRRRQILLKEWREKENIAEPL